MYQVIIKKLNHPRDQGQERVLLGGVSADDVLQDALIALLDYSPSKLKGSWEELAVTIARNKAVSAIRKATAFRRDPASGEEIAVIPLERAARPTEEGGIAPIDLLAGGADAAAEFQSVYQQVVLRDLARQHLDDRERRIFFEMHFRGRPGDEVGPEVGLTGRRTRQIYGGILPRLWELAKRDPLFSAIEENEREDDT